MIATPSLSASVDRGRRGAPSPRPSYVDSRGTLQRCRSAYPLDPDWITRDDGLPPTCRCGRPIVRVVWDQDVAEPGTPAIVTRLRAWRHLPTRHRAGIIGSAGPAR